MGSKAKSWPLFTAEELKTVSVKSSLRMAKPAQKTSTPAKAKSSKTTKTAPSLAQKARFEEAPPAQQQSYGALPADPLPKFGDQDINNILRYKPPASPQVSSAACGHVGSVPNTTPVM